MKKSHRDALALMQLSGVSRAGDSAMALGADVGRRAGPKQIAGWVEQVGASKHVATPAKLALLGHLHHRNVPGLDPLAAAVVAPTGPQATRAAADLMRSISQHLSRRPVSNHVLDPLDRSPNELYLDRPTSTDRDRARTLDNLHPGAAKTSFSVRPRCEAVSASDRRNRVQYVETEYFSKEPLHRFETLVDPRQWPKCKLMSVCFKSMDKVKGQKKHRLNAPESGWDRVLRETVDLRAFGQAPVTTNLSIRMARGQNFIGSTFEMVPGGDGQLTHDQGYLLAEDLGDVPTVQARRYTSMKSFRFRKPIENLPVEWICPGWSLASSMLMLACMGLVHEEPTS